jgi:hypothetical protein
MGCGEEASEGTKLSDFGLAELDALSQPEDKLHAVYMPAHCMYMLSGCPSASPVSHIL